MNVRWLTLLALFTPCLATPSYQGAAAPQTQTKTSAIQSEVFQDISTAADRAREENRDEDAIRFYRQALDLRPDWQEGRWYLSTLLYQKERFLEAQKQLRFFVALNPGTGPAWALLGMSEFQNREYARSLDHLQRAITLGIGERKEMAQSVFYFVAVLRTRFEQYSDSMNLLMAIVQSGQSPDLLVDPIGLAALRLPFLPQEIPQDCRELVHLAGQATLAIQGQRRDEADKLFTEIVTKYSGEPGVHFLYGAYLIDQRPEDGAREMKRELEISPSSVPARLRMAEQYLKEEKSDQALTLAQQAVALEPNNPSAGLILGESLIVKGETTQGIAELERSRDRAPDRIRVHWDLLRAYSAAGRAEDAKREKEAIEKLNSQASHP